MLPEVSTKLHKLHDARTIAYEEYGDSDGYPIFYAHGGPGSRLEGSVFHEKGKEYGFKVIATDRPGMGLSTYQENRVLLDYPRDIAELADALGYGRFGVMGWSGGGAHTTVCAYVLAERLDFCIPLCGYTNYAELPDAASYLGTKIDQMAVGLAHSQPFLFRMMLELTALGIKFFSAQVYSEFVKMTNETDQEIAQNPLFKTHFIADQKEAVHQGGKGITRDSAIHYLDWGFRLSDIPGKVHIFHGTEDKLVPIEYAQHLADNIPDTEFHRLEGQGLDTSRFDFPDSQSRNFIGDFLAIQTPQFLGDFVAISDSIMMIFVLFIRQ